jgi:outer membrane lipoprotein-sorting protein
MIRKFESLCLVLFAVTGFCSAQIVAAGEAAELLKKADRGTSFSGTDFMATYSIVQYKPGQGTSETEVVLFRRDSKSWHTILITAPEKDAGKGFVQFDSNLWFYDPHDRQFTFSSAGNKFQNTDINNSDFAPQHYSRDYTVTSAVNEKLGSLDCVKFVLVAAVPDTDYPQIKLWVTEKDGLIRKREDYSLSGQLLRITAIPSYQLSKNHSVPVKILMVDTLRGKKINGKVEHDKTQITITDVSFEKQRDFVYTKEFLESQGR